MERKWVGHTLEPVYDEQSRILMLGSIPSPQSRAVGFYYGNPRNRFWTVLSVLFGEPVPESVAEKRAMALRHGVALWDVLAGCEIAGASDASIRNPVGNDLSRILRAAPIRAIFTTGQKAGALYRQFQQPETRREAVILPSTSPANAGWKLEDLVEAYRVILRFLGPTDSGA